jgi:hypothetical protein
LSQLQKEEEQAIANVLRELQHPSVPTAQNLKIANWLRECPPADRERYLREKEMEVRKRYKQILIETLLRQAKS